MSWKANISRHYTKNIGRGTGRYFLAILLITLFIAAVASRLFWLQIVHGDRYFELASRQQGFQRILEPERGNIYLKTLQGERLSAATTKVGARIFIDMRALKDEDAVFKKLSEITEINRETFDKILKKPQDPYEILKRRINLAEAEKILAMRLPGVGLEEERWREYHGGVSAGHVLGFVSAFENKGEYGIEKYFDEILKGRRGSVSGDTDARGLLLALTDPTEIDAEAGSDIVLTLEANVQKEAEKELAKLALRWHALSGGILILEPKTGIIRAMAALPAFDPNQYQKEKELEVFLNPFVEKIFELGSVFKPLTLAAAIDQGAITPETTYIDEGEVKIGGRVIKNFDEKARGLRTMTQVLEESLNTGAVFAMQRLGGKKLDEYFTLYGFKEKTGIELPGELRGDLSNLTTGREVEYATASFGQGIAVTPLEFAMAISSLANGGKLMKPIIREGDFEKLIRQTVKPETSTAMSRMLVDVVDRVLAGGKVKMEHYTIAAKTGTAQIPTSRLGGAKPGYSDQFMHSFFGYFPAYDPKFLIFMFLDRPQGVKYASQSLSDSFKSLVEFLINYYTISPDR